ncbi:MAG: right-handed parallel beta-helix repeat-containing protein, partial [Bacteroidota bacterium]
MDNSDPYALTYNAFISLSDDTKGELSNNLMDTTLTSFMFASAADDNYYLQSGSPAIDRGKDLTKEGITTDFNDSLQDNGATFDIGAVEFGSQGLVKACDCAVTIAPDRKWANGDKFTYAPGDTICIEAGVRDFLHLRNWTGTEEQPLIFVNLNGNVIMDHVGKKPALRFSNVQHAIIKGDGLSQTQNGIIIRRSTEGNGLVINGISKNILVEQVEVYGVKKHGIVVSHTRPDAPLLEDITIKRTYIHDVEGSGILVQTRGGMFKTLSGGNPDSLKQMEDIFVCANELKNIGKNGIQIVGMASNVVVSDNQLTQYGNLFLRGRDRGIILPQGVWNAKVFNNRLMQGGGTGVFALTVGKLEIYNNVIVEPGFQNPSTRANRAFHGIQVRDVDANTTENVHILNNTIVSPAANGLLLQNTYVNENLVANNIVTAPGAWELKWQRYYDRAYMLVRRGVPVTTKRNIFAQVTDSLYFTDVAGDDYSLTTQSPALDAGLDADSLGIAADIEGNFRFLGAHVDAGAYESTVAGECNCDLTLTRDVTFANGDAYTYAPGDTICLEAGARETLQLRNWRGTAEQPLTFINQAGVVKVGNDPMLAGIALIDCEHVRLKGNGTTGNPYGIRVANVGSGNGVTVYGTSSDIEIAHIEVKHTPFSGIMVKSDPSASLETV